MKQADLRVGSEYALPTYKPYDDAPWAARVRVATIDGRGKVTVRVVDPGMKPPKNAWNARTLKRDEQLQVATRDIACPWEQWTDRAASIGAELRARVMDQQAMRDEFDRRRADRLIVDPNRVVPEEYEEDYVASETDSEERTKLSKEYVKARGLGQYATLEQLMPLVVDLPVPVLRDILAADAHRRPGMSGTVASTFMRSAELLEVARIASKRLDGRAHGEIPQPGRVLGQPDVDFVNVIREDIAASGGELLLPPVPRLPNWIDEQERDLAPTFGWLRLAVGDTTGELLHSPACLSLRSRPVSLTDHLSWWHVMLEKPQRLCGRCGGPGVRDLIPVAGFVAAADVWQARGATRLERWQQAAFQRLLSATTIARAQALEPDITLSSRIVAALTESAPDELGWAAYALVAATQWNRLDAEFDKLTPPQQETARVLARDRLSALEAALPPTQRLLPLPQAAGVNLLRERYKQLKKHLKETVPQLDRLLFTLPGAE